jgi:hypothetical protein
MKALSAMYQVVESFFLYVSCGLGNIVFFVAVRVCLQSPTAMAWQPVALCPSDSIDPDSRPLPSPLVLPPTTPGGRCLTVSPLLPLKPTLLFWAAWTELVITVPAGSVRCSTGRMATGNGKDAMRSRVAGPRHGRRLVSH